VFTMYFSERPYQDQKSGYFGATGKPIMDLGLSNAVYDEEIGAMLYNRYFDEMLAVEDAGFDGIVLNEHHSTPFCMGGAMNIEAGIVARITERAKIVLLGNVLPIWDDPLWLVEQLNMIDLISHGRLVTGWVRGTARESVAHNAPPASNWERYQEAHDFIVKAWTVPGPWRWEGKHYNYRYVNPFSKPYQKPHPPIWIPGVVSRDTVVWAAQHRYPYVMLATQLEPTRQAFEVYDETAREMGYEAGPQHRAYNFKVHVDETEELAYEVGRKYIEGPSNPFITGNEGTVNRALLSLPGMSSSRRLPTAQVASAGRGGSGRSGYDEQLENYSIVTGTPQTVLPKIRHVLEYLRPGSIIFWDGDGAMTHDDTMRSLRLMKEEVLPRVKEMGKELGLTSPFEVDPQTGNRLDGAAAAARPVAAASADD
jgi:alkanesulfonate monooxygenase SsuD/methylene tetrahydromethanopterin reductase-like flavin-dependent oxidoreductase (luciferase family)